MNVDKRLVLILGISIISVIILFFVDPIKQDSNYHLFADNRSIAYVTNFYNVVSNLPFVIIGYLGITLLRSAGLPPGVTDLKTAHYFFFFGVFLTGFGSAYYHLQPDNATLLWESFADYDFVYGIFLHCHWGMYFCGVCPTLIAAIAAIGGAFRVLLAFY